MKRAIVAGLGLVALLFGVTASQADDFVIPCNLPRGAVTAVPAPFDKYIALDCTKMGQALKPAEGQVWAFVAMDDMSMWLTASNPSTGVSASTHYTRLSATEVSAERRTALLAELYKRFDSQLFEQSTILRMEEDTSDGVHRQIYLLLPSEGSSNAVLGIECLNDCVPLEDKPLAFLIAPAK